MKMRKKTAMIISFGLGTVMFVTTAFAEVSSKSGYEQLKDAFKYTSESCSSKLPNYTLDISFVVKDNGNVIASEESLNKYDVSKYAMESNSTRVDVSNVKTESYYYNDKEESINQNTGNGSEDIYYVNQHNSTTKAELFANPFKEKQAADVEKIADALIGNLKDYVVVTQNTDGSKELSGSLTEAQIPALVNAVTSFQFKNSFARNGNLQGKAITSKITEDIFVKEVKGNMVLNKDGLIQSILGSGVISGKDEQGTEHTVTFELLGKVLNVGATIVNKPDLSGKKVQKQVEQNYNTLSNPEKYIGKYKSDIVIEKDGKFKKIGEKIIDITKIDDKGVSGTYSEEFKTGYEDYAANKRSFSFDVKFKDKRNFYGDFNATSSGKDIKGSVSINPGSTNIYLNINERSNGSILNNDGYSPVLD